MRLFKRPKTKEERAQTGKDKLAKGIVALILKIQNGFARFMNKATKNMSASFLRWTLIIFTLTGSALSIYFIALAISKKKKEVIKIDRLRVPNYYDKNGEPVMAPDLIIVPKEHEEMERFQNYMDSLHESKTGSKLYDSILFNRPGLMDSVRMLEEIYHSQNKK